MQYLLQIRTNLGSTIGTWITLNGSVSENMEINNGFPSIKLNVSSRDYMNFVSASVFEFEAYGELKSYLIGALIEHPTANTNSVDILISEESSACGSRAIGVLNISAENLDWCASKSSGCTVKASAKGFTPELTAINNVLIKEQYVGGIFESGNFDATAIEWFGYINLDKLGRLFGDPVGGNIPAVYIRRLIENALGYIQLTSGITINYSAATDKYFADPASPYYNATITNFVVGGVKYTDLPHLNPSLHYGEVLGNLPNWTLYELLDNLAVHYLFTWRLENNNGTYSIVIRERNTWNNGMPALDLGLYYENGHLLSYCSKGEFTKLPNRIDYQQADGEPVAGGHNRTQYSEFANFVPYSNTNQYEPQTIKDKFQGTCFDNDGSSLGAAAYDKYNSSVWGVILGALTRTMGRFIVVDKDEGANPDEPKIIIVDPSSNIAGRVAITRAYTVSEDSYRGSVGMGKNNLTPARAVNWHEWIDKEFCERSNAGGFGEGRYANLKKLNPIAYPYQGKTVTARLCYSCNVMDALGMYSGQTPAIDHNVIVKIPFLNNTSFIGYIDKITVSVGDYIEVEVRY